MAVRQQSGSSGRDTDQNKDKPAGLAALVTLLLWGCVSSALIIINKRIMVDMAFAFPLILTGLNQATAAIAALAAVKLRLVPMGEPPALGFALTHLLPLGVCAAGTLFFGNVAYLSLSVSFIQILKISTPAVTLAICVLLRLERLTAPMVGSILLISAGTGVATVLEISGAGFAWDGFVYFAISVVLEAVRVVSIQRLLGQLRYNEAEVLVFLGLPAAILLLLASAIFERKGLVHTWPGFAASPHGIQMLAASMFMGTLVNLATALAIRTSSSLTFKVFGCVKNSCVVLYGVVGMGERLSSWQLLGYIISVAGFAWYTIHKRTQMQTAGKTD